MITIKKVLYLLTDKTYVNCDHGSFVIRSSDGRSDRILQRVPVTVVEQIVIFGNVTVSSFFVKFCSENGIQISYVSMYGCYYGRFSGVTKGNVFLRKKQYELFDDISKRLLLVKNIVFGKMLNMISTITYFAHNSSGDIEAVFDSAVGHIKHRFADLRTANSISEIRGIEGVATEQYFSVLDDALKNVSDSMRFVKRSRRPPENNFNACLSFLYVMLNLNCISALETFGLDSYLGYLHEMKPGRESLANDLIEEFRAPLVDRFVVSIVNKKQITEQMFEYKEQGIVLTNDGRKQLLTLWESEKAGDIWYPLLGKTVPVKIVPYLQAQLLAQYIRGDIAEYPPFHWEWK